MAVVKVERHYQSLFCQSSTELNRFLGSRKEVIADGRKLAREHTSEHQTKPGQQTFCIVSIYDDVGEWKHIATYRDGYEQD